MPEIEQVNEQKIDKTSPVHACCDFLAAISFVSSVRMLILSNHRYPLSADPWTEDDDLAEQQATSSGEGNSPESDSTKQQECSATSSGGENTHADLVLFPNKMLHPDLEINYNGNTDPDRNFFMGLALLTAQRSKDPSRQVCTLCACKLIHFFFQVCYYY